MKYGEVQGGVVPYAEASIEMYAVGTGGDGSPPTPLFASLLISDANGKFDFAGAFSCPDANALVYMVATGRRSRDEFRDRESATEPDGGVGKMRGQHPTAERNDQ